MRGAHRGSPRGGPILGSLGSAKLCSVCGAELECADYGGGSVWSCTTHGVRDWVFGNEGPHWAPRRAATLALPRSPGPQQGPDAP